MARLVTIEASVVPTGGSMTGFAIGVLDNVNVNADIVSYLAEIDATLEPFGGRFIIHGGVQDLREGPRIGDLIVIAFPSTADAQSWYESPPYQAIVALRTDNATGSVFIVDGVGPTHRGVDVLPDSLRPPTADTQASRPGIVTVEPHVRASNEHTFPAAMRVDGFDGRYRGLYTYTSRSDPEQRLGYFESEPGTLQADNWPRDEWCHVLEGSLTTVDHDGTPHQFTTGDTFIIPAGWTGTWKMETFFRKVSVLF
jgi:uncharacterized protein (DUF1330 family)/uncharacterized cupin superfamily protein